MANHSSKHHKLCSRTTWLKQSRFSQTWLTSLLPHSSKSRTQPFMGAEGTGGRYTCGPACCAAPEPSQPHASVPLPLENGKGAPQKTHEDFEMEALHRLKNRKAGTGNTKCLKRPASAKAKPACKAPKVMAKPKAAPPALQLGCGKCRGSPVGCLQCRDANFKGNRYTKAQWLALKKHHGYK